MVKLERNAKVQRKNRNTKTYTRKSLGTADAGTLVRWLICIIPTSLRRAKRINIYINIIFMYYIY